MSVSQRRSKGKPTVKKAKETKVKEEISLDDVFNVKEETPSPPPSFEEAEKQPAKSQAKGGVIVDPDKLLVWAARMKSSNSFGAWGNGANFANHMVKDVFTVDGKEIKDTKQASLLIRPHMSRPA